MFKGSPYTGEALVRCVFSFFLLTHRGGWGILSVPTVLIVLVHIYNHGGEHMAFSFMILLAPVLLLIVLFAAFLLRR